MPIPLHAITITGPYPVKALVQFDLQAGVNRHAHLRYRGVLSEQDALQLLVRQEEKPVVVQCRLPQYGILFKGYPLEAKVTESNRSLYLDVHCVSYSYFLDIQGISRSFQDTKQTYAQIVKQVYAEAQGASVITMAGKGRKIAATIFQYEETDWNFTLRMAGRVGTLVVPDIKADYPQVCFGVPVSSVQQMDLTGVCNGSGWNTGRYIEQKRWHRDTMHGQFFQRTVNDVGPYDLGDEVVLEGRSLLVVEKHMKLEGDLVKSDYVLGEERGFAVPFQHNVHLHGLSLLGTVLDTKDERMKLHLDIDHSQDKNTAFWFSYVPQQGNVMYCMPQIGTRAVLKFRTENDASGLVIHTYRTNGELCFETADYNKRYFTTEFGERLAMLPDTVYYTGASNLAELEDCRGALVETGKHVVIQAERHISMYAKGQITVQTPEHFYTTMPGSESVIDMAGREINAESPDTAIHSTAQNLRPYPAVDAVPSMRMGRRLARLVTGTVPVMANPRSE